MPGGIGRIRNHGQTATRYSARHDGILERTGETGRSCRADEVAARRCSRRGPWRRAESKRANSRENANSPSILFHDERHRGKFPGASLRAGGLTGSIPPAKSFVAGPRTQVRRRPRENPDREIIPSICFHGRGNNAVKHEPRSPEAAFSHRNPPPRQSAASKHRPIFRNKLMPASLTCQMEIPSRCGEVCSSPGRSSPHPPPAALRVFPFMGARLFPASQVTKITCRKRMYHP